MTNWTKRLWRRIAGATRRLIPTWQEIQALGGCFKHPRDLPFCLRDWWRDLSLDRRRFLVNLTIGLTVLLLLNIFHNAPLLREKEDAAMDWVMRMWKGSVRGEPVIPLGWIDIDDKTYLDWEEPLYMPREKLARLIDFALQTRPRMVVVDVDLAQRAHDYTFDEPVVKVLKQYAEKCRDRPLASEDCPPVVLLASLRTFKSDLPEQQTCESGPPVVHRRSYLDGLVDTSRHLFWASPLFDKDWDQIIRRWRLWEPVCRETDNRPVALPSIQLLAATLLTGRKGAMEDLQSCLDSMVLKGYTATTESPVRGDEPPCTVTLWDAVEQREDKQLSLSQDRMARRIHYTIPWQGDAPGVSGGTIPIVKTIEGQKEGPERLLVSRVPARSVLSVIDRQGQSGGADLQGRVVFIGGSFRDGRDIHGSPLGEMPGVLILMNALHSLLQYKEINLALKSLFEVLVIAMLSIIFSIGGTSWGKIIVDFAIIAFLAPLSSLLSVWLFGYGYWLNFALAGTAIKIYQIGAKIHQIAASFLKSRAAHRRTMASVKVPPEDDGQDR